MKYTIKDLSEGKCAVINDGTLEELREVLSKAFPFSKAKTSGSFKYYSLTPSVNKEWYPLRETNLPTQSVKEFLTEEEFVLPEKWCVRENKVTNDWASKTFGCGNFVFQQPRFLCVDTEFFPMFKSYHFLSREDKDKGGYAEITFEQFEKYVLGKNTEMKKEYRITYKQAQSIINIACATWKNKLAELWAKEIVLQSNEIIIPNTFYNEMRIACTHEQNILFDEIFGKVDFEVGKWVKWEGINPVVAKIHSKGLSNCYVLDVNGNTSSHDSCHISLLREATPEEIEKAQCPYKGGELIFVKDCSDAAWYLRYFARFEGGEVRTYMEQKKSGRTTSWRFHAPAPNVKLPD